MIPQQVASGENCNFGEVTTTDGAVAANKLMIIEDDKQFFVNYNAAMTVRQEVFDKNPKLAEVFDPISKALTTEVMRGLNEQVDVGGELEDDVAEQFLKDNGFIWLALGDLAPRGGAAAGQTGPTSSVTS